MIRVTTFAMIITVGSLATAGCGQKGSEANPFKIAIARFQQETCTFCPGGDTDVERWTRLRPPYRGEELFEADSYIAGFVARAREYGGVRLVGLESPGDVFGGSSASWITEETFEYFMERILRDLSENMPVDGVYLALHGAMAVRNIPRPEAEIARRVRQVVGDDVPIVGTFDLHGNEDEEFLRWADIAFVVKRFPHYDAYIQGERAARMLIRTMRGDFKPTTAVRKPGIITATVLQWTGQSPSADIMERARRWEARENDAYVSVFYGYPWSDVPDVGATAIAITNDDQELADRIADDMSDYMWRVREEFAHGDFPKPEEGVRRVKAAIAAGQTPVAIGDYSDRPGDATFILRELIDQGVDNFIYGTLRDEQALTELAESNAQPGDPFSMDVGGFTPSGGEPVHIEGTVVYRGPQWGYDNVAAVEFGNHNMLVLTPAYTQIMFPEELRFGPIEPDEYEVFVVKSRAHFRRGFDETGYARSIFIIDAPAPFVGTTALDALDYQFAPIDKLYPFGMPEGR
jgi:microcystin degradation protein MlrC